MKNKNALGRTAQNNVLQNTTAQTTYTLNTGSLATGVYQFVAKQSGSTIYTQKMVIAK